MLKKRKATSLSKRDSRKMKRRRARKGSRVRLELEIINQNSSSSSSLSSDDSGSSSDHNDDDDDEEDESSVGSKMESSAIVTMLHDPKTSVATFKRHVQNNPNLTREDFEGFDDSEDNRLTDPLYLAKYDILYKFLQIQLQKFLLLRVVGYEFLQQNGPFDNYKPMLMIMINATHEAKHISRQLKWPNLFKVSELWDYYWSGYINWNRRRLLASNQTFKR